MKLLHIIPASAMLPTLSIQTKTKVALWSVRCPMKNHSFCKNAWTTFLFEKRRRNCTPAVTKCSQPFTCSTGYSSCLHPELTFDTSSKTLFSQHAKDHHISILQTMGGKKRTH